MQAVSTFVQSAPTAPQPNPFAVHPTTPGAVQLHLTDGFNGFECVADLTPDQVGSLIAELKSAKNYVEETR